MLRLILGRAGTGKTSRIMEEIRAHAPADKDPGQHCVLIVPEQYSHEAERELCRVVGDRLSLYAEVLSFTRLAHTVALEAGGSARRYLDKGGRVLCMALALEAAAPALRICGTAHARPELLHSLLDAVAELRSACIGSDELLAAAEQADGPLADKLHDLSLLLASYDAVTARAGADPADRLDLLAEQIPDSPSLRGAQVYVDGFIDFTMQEQKVLLSLMRTAASVTVCLGCDDLKGGSEVFDLSRSAALQLLADAREHGIPASADTVVVPESSGAMGFLEKNLFSFTEECFDAGDTVTLLRARTPAEECELAAARVLKLVRETGCRWWDVAVAVRGFEEYRTSLESAFSRFGVPLYLTRRSDILSKPLPALISAAFAVVTGGWDAEDVFTYLKTGLANLTRAECDELENYCLLWDIHGSAWTNPAPWRQHPEGLGIPPTEESEAQLAAINSLRERAAAPLLALQEHGAAAHTAREQAEALCAFLDALELANRLDEHAGALESKGRSADAAEYLQLWELLTSAIEQCADILGNTPMEQQPFARLLELVLSQYDVGTIPVALDRVSAGDMDRMRRRHLRHLLVLGASDERLPLLADGGRLLSDADRQSLRELGLDLGGDGRESLSREFSLIYNCLTLPSETLYLSFAGGTDARPSFVADRLRSLFGVEARSGDLAAARTEARVPALSLAASHDLGTHSCAARRYFQNIPEEAELLQTIEKQAKIERGRLSAEAVRGLYGDQLRLSASRIDRFSACRFSYFLQYGLRAKPRVPARFDPPAYGSFLHFVLAYVAEHAEHRGGFAALDNKALAELADEAAEAYVHEKLDDFREKSPRFIYLFRRLTHTVRQIVLDMAEELRTSDFHPLDFELDLSRAGDLPPMKLGTGKDSLTLTGVADRVDGWVHDGKLYLRVVDYKTGRKEFSLSDVWHGMGLQMLLYLFTLERGGLKRYGREIVPAGVLYVPARDALIQFPGDADDAEILKKKASERRRSGLLLNDAAVLNAMEHNHPPRFLPVKFNRSGEAVGESLARTEQLAQLSRFVDGTLRAMAAELRQGSVAADPFFRNQKENACVWCNYREACHFDESVDNRRCLTKLKAPEFWEKLTELETKEGGPDHG